MRTRNLTIFAAALAGVSAASAAEMPVKAPPIRTPIPPSVVSAAAPSWAGFYVGGNIGYGFGVSNSDTTHLPTQAGFNADPFGQSNSPRGYLAGVQAGYNIQSDMFVYGIEGDWSYSRLRSSSATGPLPLFGGAADPGSSQTVNAALNWIATARLRLGFTMGDNMLIYGTGGIALGGVNYEVVTDYVGDPFRFPGSVSKTRSGLTGGGGVEMGFSGNWTMKAEYLYIDLGRETIVANPVAANPPFQVRTDHALRTQVVRLGLNYRFGNATTVAARY